MSGTPLALAGLLGAVTAVEAVRAVRGTGHASLAVAMTGLTVGRVLDTDELSERFGEAAWLVTGRHAAGLVVAIGMVAFARSITGSRRRRSAPWVWAVLALGLAVPLVDAAAVVPTSKAARLALYAASPVWLVHWAAYLGVSLVAAGAVTVMCVRSVRASRGLFRAQLGFLAAAATSIALYSLLTAVHLTTLALGGGAWLGRLAGTEQVASNLAALVVALALLLGLLEPVVEAAGRRARVWALWPLWDALWDLAPHLEAERPGRWRSALARDPHLVLVRLVVEVGDAARVLAPYVPAHDASRATEHAAALQVAVGRHRRHEPAGAGSPAPDLDRTLAQRAAELQELARAWDAPGTAAARERLAGRVGAAP